MRSDLFVINYVTVISTKAEFEGQVSVIAVLSGQLKDDVRDFLKSIPEPLKKTVESVCTDMYDRFVNAVTEVFGDRVLVIDRYHVFKLYREPLDSLLNRLKSEQSEEKYSWLEGMMWILRKQHEVV